MSWAFSPSIPTVASEQVEIAPGTGCIKYYDGSKWMLMPIKTFVPGVDMWKRKPLKRYNGSNWVPTNFTGSIASANSTTSSSSFTLVTPGNVTTKDIFVGFYASVDNSDYYTANNTPPTSRLISTENHNNDERRSHLICYEVLESLGDRSVSSPGSLDGRWNGGFYFRPKYRIKEVRISPINFQVTTGTSSPSTQTVNVHQATYPSIVFAGIVMDSGMSNPNFTTSFDGSVSNSSNFGGLQTRFSYRLYNTPPGGAFSVVPNMGSANIDCRSMTSFYLEFVPV